MEHDITTHFVLRFGSLMKLARPKRYGSYTRGEMLILSYLYDRTEPALPGELSAIMEASSARVAAALRRLEAKGQIARSIDDKDRRRILVSITDAGRKLVEARRLEVHNYCAEVIARLGEDDTREGMRILGRIIEIAQTLEVQTLTEDIAEKGDDNLAE